MSALALETVVNLLGIRQLEYGSSIQRFVIGSISVATMLVAPHDDRYLGVPAHDGADLERHGILARH